MNIHEWLYYYASNIFKLELYIFIKHLEDVISKHMKVDALILNASAY